VPIEPWETKGEVAAKIDAHFTNHDPTDPPNEAQLAECEEFGLLKLVKSRKMNRKQVYWLLQNELQRRRNEETAV
jgi:hypothetical protein